MPRFIKGLDKEYAYTAAVMRNLEKLRTRSPRVFKAYLRFTGMDLVQGQSSLYAYGAVIRGGKKASWSIIPEVEVDADISGYAHYYGDRIQLHKTFVETFEALMSVDEWTGRDRYGQYDEERRPTTGERQKAARLLMESKILHEMVHWGRSTVTFQPDHQGPNDYGWRFEKAAYGKHMTRSSLGLQDYIDVPGNK